MSYENAPATKMLATHCCACARPLLDAASVTAGLGPHCRKKHGVPNDLDEETRERANALIHACAKERVSLETLQAAVVELALLGCAKLADRISKRAGRIVVTISTLLNGDTAVDVKAPYSEAFLAARGAGQWVKDGKKTRYPAAKALDAATAIAAGFPGMLIRLENGDDAPAFCTPDTLTQALQAVVDAAPSTGDQLDKGQRMHGGSPARLPRKAGGGWGVCFDECDAAITGDLVVITTSKGSQWVGRLAKCYPGFGRTGEQLWAYERTDIAVPTDAPTPAPKAPAPTSAEPVKWHGTPTELRAGWGAKMKFHLGALDGEWPKEGDRVRITTRGGATWVAELAEDARVNRYRDAWVALTVRCGR